jgi:sugar phosphate permease
MAGGSAGQFLVGPIIKSGVSWDRFWIYAGCLGLIISGVLLVLLPKEIRKATPGGASAFSVLLRSLGRVFRNPQSLLCGFISGLLFIPTTILGMTWGVRFLQEARGREFEAAVTLAASVPIGWMIGCPLLGFISDRLGRRKPVIFGGAFMLLAVVTWVLFGNPEILRGHTVGILMGIASGAAMLPYTVIKEANPPELGGTATGVVNFINFTFSALLGPVFGARLVEMPEGDTSLALAHYQAGFQPLLYGIVGALILTLFLRETGPASKRT